MKTPNDFFWIYLWPLCIQSIETRSGLLGRIGWLYAHFLKKISIDKDGTIDGISYSLNIVYRMMCHKVGPMLSYSHGRNV